MHTKKGTFLFRLPPKLKRPCLFTLFDEIRNRSAFSCSTFVTDTLTNIRILFRTVCIGQMVQLTKVKQLYTIASNFDYT